MSESRRLVVVLAISGLLGGLVACDDPDQTPPADEGTAASEQASVSWPTASPPEGWAVESREVSDGSYDPTVLAIHREGVELVPGLYNQDGSPSVTVDISEIRRPPEDILESRLDDRVIDGVTFVGYTDSATLDDGDVVYFNSWWGQIPDDGFTIRILESSGTEDEKSLDELSAITDTITWPEGTTWAFDKWRDQPW